MKKDKIICLKGHDSSIGKQLSDINQPYSQVFTSLSAPSLFCDFLQLWRRERGGGEVESWVQHGGQTAREKIPLS